MKTFGSFYQNDQIIYYQVIFEIFSHLATTDVGISENNTS